MLKETVSNDARREDAVDIFQTSLVVEKKSGGELPPLSKYSSDARKSHMFLDHSNQSLPDRPVAQEILGNEDTLDGMASNSLLQDLNQLEKGEGRAKKEPREPTKRKRWGQKKKTKDEVLESLHKFNT